MLCKCLPPASAASLVECGNPCRYVEVSRFLFLFIFIQTFLYLRFWFFFLVFGLMGVWINTFVAFFHRCGCAINLFFFFYMFDVFIVFFRLVLLLLLTTFFACAVDSVEPLTWLCKLELRLLALKWRPERQRLRIVGQCRRMFACRKRNAFRAAPSARRWPTITRRFPIGAHRRRALVNVIAVLITIVTCKSRVSDKNIDTTGKSSANFTARCSTNRMTSVSTTRCGVSVPFPWCRRSRSNLRPALNRIRFWPCRPIQNLPRLTSWSKQYSSTEKILNSILLLFLKREFTPMTFSGSDEDDGMSQIHHQYSKSGLSEGHSYYGSTNPYHPRYNTPVSEIHHNDVEVVVATADIEQVVPVVEMEEKENNEGREFRPELMNLLIDRMEGRKWSRRSPSACSAADGLSTSAEHSTTAGAATTTTTTNTTNNNTTATTVQLVDEATQSCPSSVGGWMAGNLKGCQTSKTNSSCSLNVAASDGLALPLDIARSGLPLKGTFPSFEVLPGGRLVRFQFLFFNTPPPPPPLITMCGRHIHSPPPSPHSLRLRCSASVGFFYFISSPPSSTYLYFFIS